ncbi:MAG: hypothetical protein PHD43_15640 [Methylococcales bacterium]|nr:hypothetical protein [Methylococcales bacterium]
MFDLFKDIETYKGITPYASEHYGVYQPILGWESKLTKKWIQRGGILIDPQVKRILDGRILPGPKEVEVRVFEGVLSWHVNNPFQLFTALPLEPGSEKSPFKVILAKDLNSELLKLVQIQVQTFVDNNNGRLPENGEWNQLIEINNLMDADNGPLRETNDIHWIQLFKDMQAQVQDQPITEAMLTAAKRKLLELMQYESQIATFLLFHVGGQPGYDPNELKKLFSVQVAPPLSDILLPTDPLANIEDPLANIDPKSKSGALSPVGFVHLFRQYFFDLGTFLGEPVEHIWLAPGTTIELIEVSTRKTTIERTQESNEETTIRSEQSTSVKDELSDAVKSENGSSTKLGVTTKQTVDYKVYQGTATASLGAESTRKDARETSHKQNREQSEKLSSEIKRSFKSVFKTVTETTDTRSRRYVLQNTGPDLINYELRRKMRRVGVQLQDLGSQLCWQVFIDNAGATLGLAELVHFAESPDLANLKQPEIGPPPAPIKITVSTKIPFLGFRTNDDNGAGAIYGNTGLIEKVDERYKGSYRGVRTNTTNDEAQDREVVMGPFPFKIAPPKSNYELAEVRPLGPQGKQQQANARPVETFNKSDGSFDLVLDSVDFGGENLFLFDVELKFVPVEAAFKEYEVFKAEAQKKYDAEVSRLRKKNFMESVRDRIKDASTIKPRPSWDLREEERAIVYRQLIARLMLDSWKLPDTEDSRRLSHVRSEVIRAIFDVDAMLYFVAPEWWMPRRHQTKHNLTAYANALSRKPSNLTEDDTVKWKDVESRQDNYLITEDSATAKLGSSLGWLLQLDGDNLRNAFLNAPWVKAVIPIRPGREKAALNWLHSIEGHEQDGWDTKYTGSNTPEDQAILAELAAELKEPTIGNVLEKIADRMEKQNSDIKNVLKADEVFENGFSHLGKNSFNAGLPANQVFSQWISVLPTDQIVAVEYKSTDLFEP